ncbi:hypothetical protein K7X08_028339 [Anisodus acutangulus]|uniref:Uncharacterized protein n=1 Tax=Anisodus acutangulus TaxID=402998 RepID=A0A9Q1M881_9SOLA|nr:hypothetical protein K7X08_028339 [Anisodus acutangulus]
MTPSTSGTKSVLDGMTEANMITLEANAFNCTAQSTQSIQTATKVNGTVTRQMAKQPMLEHVGDQEKTTGPEAVVPVEQPSTSTNPPQSKQSMVQQTAQDVAKQVPGFVEPSPRVDHAKQPSP